MVSVIGGAEAAFVDAGKSFSSLSLNQRLMDRVPTQASALPTLDQRLHLRPGQATSRLQLAVQDEIIDTFAIDELIATLGNYPSGAARANFIILADYTNSPLAITAVERQIRLFTEVLPEKFALWLERSGKYMELIRPILRSHGLPEDLVFLPLIESGYNPYAYSPAKAAGPWQFIKGTGKKYGLKINFWVDERRDPVKSTHAAARYLKDLYERFDSWTLAMAAYNAGEGKIERALRKSKSDDYWPLLKTRYLRNETKNYVAKFIAARLIAANPESYGFTGIEYHSPFEYEAVVVPSPLDLDVIARAAETTYEHIKELNPELRTWCTPLEADTYTVRIPKGRTEVFLANLNSVPPEKRFTLKPYTVKKGETLTGIANREKVPQEVLVSINSLHNNKTVRQGQMIYLPPKDKITLCKNLVQIEKSKARKKKSAKKLVT